MKQARLGSQVVQSCPRAAAATGALPFKSSRNPDLPHFPLRGRQRRHLAPELRHHDLVCCIFFLGQKTKVGLAWILIRSTWRVQGGCRSACRSPDTASQPPRPAWEKLCRYGCLFFPYFFCVLIPWTLNTMKILARPWWDPEPPFSFWFRHRLLSDSHDQSPGPAKNPCPPLNKRLFHPLTDL